MSTTTLSAATSRPGEDPLVAAAGRFATARPQYRLPDSFEPPSTVRPYGMRFLNPIGTTTDVWPPSYRYDPDRQLSVNPKGVPRYQADRPHSTTGSSDGGSGPMEEWTYD